MRNSAFQQRSLRRLILPLIGVMLPATAAMAANTGASPSAGADADMKPRAEQLWRTLDTNGDGVVSRAEFNAHQGDDFVARMPSQTATFTGTMRASDLIGKDVRNRQGDDLGEVHDLLVDVNSGRIRGAIVSMGGVMNLGDKLYEYPLSRFERSADGDKLVINVDEQQIRAARGFDRNNWPYAASTVGDASKARPTEGLWRASRLIGRDVDDRTGDHLGEIRDLVIDARNQRVRSAILRYDRPWSLDNSLVGLPLSSLRFGEDRETLSMNVDRDRLGEQLEQANASNVSADAGEHRNVIVERWVVFMPAEVGTTDASPNGDRGQPGGTGTASANVPIGSSMAPATATTAEFNRLDTNHDGQISRSEFGSESLPAGFDVMDRNNNQSLSREEFAGAAAATPPAR